MLELSSISDLPNVPAVYAMYGGRDRGLYVAYIGVASKLKPRVIQHLVRRDSSVAAGTSAVMLNPDYVTELRWWEHPDFAARHVLEAAELVEFDLFDPALRSRGGIREQSRELYADESFRARMQALLSGAPAGRLVVPAPEDAFERIAAIERRLTALEQRFVND